MSQDEFADAPDESSDERLPDESSDGRLDEPGEPADEPGELADVSPVEYVAAANVPRDVRRNALRDDRLHDDRHVR